MRSILAFLCLVACQNQTRRFIAVGDTGRGNDDQLAVAQAMTSKCAKDGCDFVLMLGDNFYLSGVTSLQDEQWQSKWEKPYSRIKAPFYVALGNHDYGGAGGGFEQEQASYQVQYSAKSKRWRMPARYYQQREGAVDLVALDTTAMLFQGEDEQQSETSAYLARSNAPWKIAFGHHPYFSNGPHGDAGHYDGLAENDARAGSAVKTTLEQAVCGKADLYLAGHEHNLQVLAETCAGTTLIVSGAGATTTAMHGSHDEAFAREALGFVYFVATEDTLSYEVLTVADQVVHSGKLTKKH